MAHQGIVMFCRVKHSRPLIHNHVPVFVYNGMIGSVFVLRCWFLILLSIEVQYTLIWAWLQPIVCTVTGPRTSLVFCLKKFFINLDMIVLHILPLSSTWVSFLLILSVSAIYIHPSAENKQKINNLLVLNHISLPITFLQFCFLQSPTLFCL